MDRASRRRFSHLKQSFDGEQTYTSESDWLCATADKSAGHVRCSSGWATRDYVVLKACRQSKKSRISHYGARWLLTDFYIDDKTNQVKGVLSRMYDFNGTFLHDLVEIEKYRVVDGVVIPEKYSQRFDLGQLGVIYANLSQRILW